MTVDYEVRTHVGALIQTTPDRNKAIKTASEKRDQFPGIYVEEVVRTEQRKAVWTDRKLRAVA